MVERVPPVLALDAVRPVGVAARSLQRQRGWQSHSANDQQHNHPGVPLFAPALKHVLSIVEVGDSVPEPWPLKRWLYDQDPSPHQCAGPARSLRADRRRSLRLQEISADHGRRWTSTKVLLADTEHRAVPGAREDAQAMTLTSFAKTWKRRGGVAMIPTKRNRLIQLPVDAAIYALRNMVERCFNKLKNARMLATRYDKTADSYLGFIHIVSIRLWMRQFVNAS